MTTRGRLAQVLPLVLLLVAASCTDDDGFRDLGEFTTDENFYAEFAEYTPEQTERIAERKAAFEAFVAELPIQPIDSTAYFTELMEGEITYLYPEPDDDDGNDAMLADALSMAHAIEATGYQAERYFCRPGRDGVLPRIEITFRSPPGTVDHFVTLSWNQQLYDTAVVQSWYPDGITPKPLDPVSDRTDFFPNEG